MAKTLEDLLRAETVTLPKYLVVKTDANEFRHITNGQEVFRIDGHKVWNQKNDEAGKLVDNKVILSVEDSRVDYIANENSEPYVGLTNPVSVAVEAGADKDRLVLQYFKEFVKGRFSFGPIVFVTDVIDSEGDVQAPANGGNTVTQSEPGEGTQSASGTPAQA